MALRYGNFVKIWYFVHIFKRLLASKNGKSCNLTNLQLWVLQSEALRYCSKVFEILANINGCSSQVNGHDEHMHAKEEEDTAIDLNFDFRAYAWL